MKTVALYAPEAYWTLDHAVRQAITNGCGTKGWLGRLVPDHIYGLRVTSACNIHDYMYAVGETEEDKCEADKVLLNNLLRIIDANTSFWLLRKLRYNRALVYYRAVQRFGGPAFWNDKNPRENIGTVFTFA
jgi:hypothetical protein